MPMSMPEGLEATLLRGEETRHFNVDIKKGKALAAGHCVTVVQIDSTVGSKLFITLINQSHIFV